MRKLFISFISFVIALFLLTMQVGYGIAQERLQDKVSAKSADANLSGEEGSSTSVPTGESGEVLPVSGKSEARVLTSKDFIIEIEKIGLKKEVEPNVDPRSKDIYGPVIAEKVAHGMFTKFPDETAYEKSGNVYLYAHRDGDSAYFKRIGELEKEDVINLYFLGRTYVYQVSTSFIVSPLATYIYTGQSSTPTLTLQTCNNGVKERLIVKADLVEVI